MRRNGFKDGSRGFTLIELVVVLSVILVVMAISFPSIRTTMEGIRHRNAVAAATAAIQTTRFQAIRFGTTYALQFNPGNGSYQVSRIPPGAAAGFVNVGGVIPLGSGPISLNVGTRFEFAPNGTVTVTAGAMNFNVQYGAGANMKSRSITVSRVGHVQVQ